MHFMFLEELNRRIRESGINLRLSRMYFFQNISQLPDHCHKTQRTSLSLRISRIYLGLRPLFQGSLSPFHILPSATLVVYHMPIKIREKNTVLTQHSVNAHTNPLSEKQSLSESCGGLTRRRLFLESVRSAISCKAP